MFIRGCIAGSDGLTSDNFKFDRSVTQKVVGIQIQERVRYTMDGRLNILAITALY